MLIWFVKNGLSMIKVSKDVINRMSYPIFPSDNTQAVFSFLQVISVWTGEQSMQNCIQLIKLFPFVKLTISSPFEAGSWFPSENQLPVWKGLLANWKSIPGFITDLQMDPIWTANEFLTGSRFRAGNQLLVSYLTFKWVHLRNLSTCVSYHLESEGLIDRREKNELSKGLRKFRWDHMDHVNSQLESVLAEPCGKRQFMRSVERLCWNHADYVRTPTCSRNVLRSSCGPRELPRLVRRI